MKPAWEALRSLAAQSGACFDTRYKGEITFISHDALQRFVAALSTQALPIHAELYRHIKTGGVYEVICNAQDESAPERMLIVYRNVKTGDRWVRSAVEFNDGRFERVKLGDTGTKPSAQAAKFICNKGNLCPWSDGDPSYCRRCGERAQGSCQ